MKVLEKYEVLVPCYWILVSLCKKTKALQTVKVDMNSYVEDIGNVLLIVCNPQQNRIVSKQ